MRCMSYVVGSRKSANCRHRPREFQRANGFGLEAGRAGGSDAKSKHPLMQSVEDEIGGTRDERERGVHPRLAGGIDFSRFREPTCVLMPPISMKRWSRRLLEATRHL